MLETRLRSDIAGREDGFPEGSGPKTADSLRKSIERNNYIEAVAGRYHVGYEELRKLVVRTAVQGRSGPAG